MTSISIKEARKASGLTQVRAAKIIGVSLRALQEWEDGRRIPKKGDEYWANVFHALSYLTADGLAAVEAGEITLDEAVAIGKREDVKRASRVGAFGDTFAAAWDKIPDKAITDLDAETLAALVDVIAMVDHKE